MKTIKKSSPLRRRIAIGAMLTLVLFAGAGAMMRDHLHTYRHLKAHAREHRDHMDLSTERLTENGAFRVAVEPDVNPVPLSKLHTWTLHVETADGRPVDDASIVVDGGMPDHGHGLPTRPAVTQALGGGDYRVEGMKFQMPGWWIVSFEVAAGQGADRVVFNLML